jgi:hypothetical protein
LGWGCFALDLPPKADTIAGAISRTRRVKAAGGKEPAMNATMITCPNCGAEILFSEALHEQFCH